MWVGGSLNFRLKWVFHWIPFRFEAFVTMRRSRELWTKADDWQMAVYNST